MISWESVLQSAKLFYCLASSVFVPATQERTEPALPFHRLTGSVFTGLDFLAV